VRRDESEGAGTGEQARDRSHLSLWHMYRERWEALGLGRTRRSRDVLLLTASAISYSAVTIFGSVLTCPTPITFMSHLATDLEPDVSDVRQTIFALRSTVVGWMRHWGHQQADCEDLAWISRPRRPKRRSRRAGERRREKALFFTVFRDNQARKRQTSPFPPSQNSSCHPSIEHAREH